MVRGWADVSWRGRGGAGIPIQTSVQACSPAWPAATIALRRRSMHEWWPRRPAGRARLYVFCAANWYTQHSQRACMQRSVAASRNSRSRSRRAAVLRTRAISTAPRPAVNKALMYRSSPLREKRVGGRGGAGGAALQAGSAAVAAVTLLHPACLPTVQAPGASPVDQRLGVQQQALHLLG